MPGWAFRWVVVLCLLHATAQPLAYTRTAPHRAIRAAAWQSRPHGDVACRSPFFHGYGQGTRQLVELLSAFGLTALIGLEREIQGKRAGLRTQAIVGTSAALILIISKYGFADVLNAGTIVLDPSRVAAQIVSGIGFLGAGLIITRRGAVHGLTTAAAICECAAIGMAAGSGLLLLAVTVTALHFVIIVGFSPVAQRLTNRLGGAIQLQVTYQDERAVLGQLLDVCEHHGWQVTSVVTAPVSAGAAAAPAEPGDAAVAMTVSGRGVLRVTRVLAMVEGVSSVKRLDADLE
jgi:putative Mg2+ transporter-C (MgtC) family protein